MNNADFEKVKQLTKAYIRSFEITPDEDDFVKHPVVTMSEIPHPYNPRYGLPKRKEVIDIWVASGSKEFLNLTDPDDREVWYSIIEERIDVAKSLDTIYLGIIRRNWLASWMDFVKDHLSIDDRRKITSML